VCICDEIFAPAGADGLREKGIGYI